jgi:hypothetical protein
VLVLDVLLFPQCIIGGGGYYGAIDERKSRIIPIRMAEDCWEVSYGNEDGATAHYEAEEPNKLRNPSCRCLR